MNRYRSLLATKVLQIPERARFAGPFILIALFLLPVYGQQQTAATSPDESQVAASSPSTPAAPGSPKVSASPEGTDDLRYRIGPGDILDIKIFNKPQFNREGVRVDPRGMIRMPLIKEEIVAACQTENQQSPP